MRIRYVYSLRAFCNLMGAAGGSQKSDPAQKRYTSDARPSFRGWRGWPARLVC